MSLRDRLPGRKARPGLPRAAQSGELEHLQTWAGTRRGVEGFVEPQTATTAMTLVLVAADGEWTRRRVESPKAAFGFGKKTGIPVYDVNRLGYPQRMRDWNSRQRILAKRARQKTT